MEVTDGPDVGVHILRPPELEALQDGEEFEAIDDATWTDVNSATDTVVLGEGEYWIVAISADREPVNA